MIESLKERIILHVLKMQMRGVFGDQVRLRAEKRPIVEQMLYAVWGELEAIVREQVTPVSDAVYLAETEARNARTNVKLAQESVVAAQRAVDAATACAARADLALVDAKEQFQKVVERIHGK